jgi:hypothetical protein
MKRSPKPIMVYVSLVLACFSIMGHESIIKMDKDRRLASNGSSSICILVGSAIKHLASSRIRLIQCDGLLLLVRSAFEWLFAIHSGQFSHSPDIYKLGAYFSAIQSGRKKLATFFTIS